MQSLAIVKLIFERLMTDIRKYQGMIIHMNFSASGLCDKHKHSTLTNRIV